MATQCLKGLSTAPRLMWRPLLCYLCDMLVGLLGNSCSSSPPGTSCIRCKNRFVWPASTWLCFMEARFVDEIFLICSGSSVRSVAPKTEMKHIPETSKILCQSFTVGSSDDVDMCNMPDTASNLAPSTREWEKPHSLWLWITSNLWSMTHTSSPYFLSCVPSVLGDVWKTNMEETQRQRVANVGELIDLEDRTTGFVAIVLTGPVIVRRLDFIGWVYDKPRITHGDGMIS